MKQRSKFQPKYGTANQGFRPRNAYKTPPPEPALDVNPEDLQIDRSQRRNRPHKPRKFLRGST